MGVCFTKTETEVRLEAAGYGKTKPKPMVYFIQGQKTKLIKIGYTSGCPLVRLANIQYSSPDRLLLLGAMKGGRGVENRQHINWRGQRQHGEWFKPSKDLLSYIETHKVKCDCKSCVSNELKR